MNQPRNDGRNYLSAQIAVASWIMKALNPKAMGICTTCYLAESAVRFTIGTPPIVNVDAAEADCSTFTTPILFPYLGISYE